MEYKDENGKVLYGFSQIDMERNNNLLEKLHQEQKRINLRGWAWFILVVLFLVYLKFANIVNNIVARCV